MTVLEGLLQAIVDDAQAEDRWLILADWLEENDDPRRAELLRLHRRLLATCCEPEQHPERSTWQARIVQLLGQGLQPYVPHKTLLLAKNVEMTFSFIPPSSFLMGSPRGEYEFQPDEAAPHRVTLTQGYWLGVFPVTQAQWQAVMGSNPSRFKAKQRPVERVTWNDCQEFCTRLSKSLQSSCRLPTDAEWEHACRAGTTTPFHFGQTISTDVANYDGKQTDGNSARGVFRNQTTKVGSFPPNAWGLYDLHGTVWEWCQETQSDETHRIEYGFLRGGCWRAYPVACRSAARCQFLQDTRNGLCGCRIVLSQE